MSASRHTLLEDIQALLAGTLLVALGVALIGKASLITGGAVGIAFLLHYTSGLGFGKLFFLINLPFYLLAVAISVLGAAVLNLSLAINHRPGRYMAI